MGYSTIGNCRLYECKLVDTIARAAKRGRDETNFRLPRQGQATNAKTVVR